MLATSGAQKAVSILAHAAGLFQVSFRVLGSASSAFRLAQIRQVSMNVKVCSESPVKMSALNTSVLKADRDELAKAMEAANLPTILMVLVHITGDRSWLRPPYRPSKPRALNLNDSAGLPDELQQEVRARCVDAIVDWESKGRPSLLVPDEDFLVEMMSACVGEPVAPEYGPMMAEEMTLLDRDQAWQDGAKALAGSGMSVLIVGAGISGLCMAAKLIEAGVSFRIVEKNPDVGGTWYENTYPGARVDAPSHFYAFSFAPNPDWSHYYANREEIYRYLRELSERSGVYDRIEFNSELTEASWDETAQCWHTRVRHSDGTEHLDDTNVIVTAVGLLNRPAIPSLPGIESYEGTAIHTARWPKDFNVDGKRVAVIGTGASAMQVVPAIAGTAAKVTVYQRSPQWAVPNENYRRDVDPRVKYLLKHVPCYDQWFRFRLFWVFNDKVHPTLQKDPNWIHPERSINAKNDRNREFLTRYIKDELGDRLDLLPKVLPDYPPYGKRMLMDNGWFRTMARDDVELVTDPISRVTKSGIVSEDATERDFDVIIFATGFEARRMLAPMTIVGRYGESIRQLWGDDDARAYLGITVAGFPNFFCLYGPNTNLGHGGSIIFQIELQAAYVMQLLTYMAEHGYTEVDVRDDVQDLYNKELDDAHAKMIWTHEGMDTWYRNSAGRIVTNSPWRCVDYWRLTHLVSYEDFVFLAPPDTPTTESSEPPQALAEPTGN